jgi:hypothetical protein
MIKLALWLNCVWAEPHLKSRQLCSSSTISQNVMEPEVPLPCSQVPSSMTFVIFINKPVFTMSCQPHTKARGPPLVGCSQLLSIYSQLPSIPGGRLLQSLLEDAPCRGDKRLTWYADLHCMYKVMSMNSLHGQFSSGCFSPYREQSSIPTVHWLYRAVVDKRKSRASSQCLFEGWGTLLAFLTKMLAWIIKTLKKTWL